MTTEDRELLQYKIEAEGFDYCFVHYNDWKEVKDDEFHRLREAYVKAQEELNDYINQEDEEE